MRNLLIRLFINAASLWVVDRLFQDVWFADTESLILTALVIGLLNTFIKPVLVILTLPINLLSLGLFTIVINALILKLADYLVDDFTVLGFGTALLAALLISIVSIFLNMLLKDK